MLEAASKNSHRILSWLNGTEWIVVQHMGLIEDWIMWGSLRLIIQLLITQLDHISCDTCMHQPSRVWNIFCGANFYIYNSIECVCVWPTAGRHYPKFFQNTLQIDANKFAIDCIWLSCSLYCAISWQHITDVTRGVCVLWNVQDLGMKMDYNSTISRWILFSTKPTMPIIYCYTCQWHKYFVLVLFHR